MRDFSEDNYYIDFINLQRKILSSTNSYDKKEIQTIQKEKFRYITRLVGDLFDYKNSRKAYNTISNLIVTSLTSFDDKQPIDIFSGEKEEKKEDHEIEEHRDTLVQEFKNQVDEYKAILSIGKSFIDVINRFSQQYEVVNNIIFSPTLHKPNGMPN